MPKKIALTFLAAASPAILLVFFLGSRFGEVLFTLLAVAFPIALAALGAARRGRLGPLGVPLLVLLAYFEACAVAMLALGGKVAGAPWVLGLPLAAAVQVYGLFLLPLVAVAWLYARTFERFGLRREDLDALRRRFGRGETGD